MYRFVVQCERIIDGTEDIFGIGNDFQHYLLSSQEVTLHKNWEFASFTVDPEIKVFYPEYGCSQALDTWIEAKCYPATEFFSLIQKCDSVTCRFEKIDEEAKKIFPRFHIIKEIDYVKIVRDLEKKKLLSIRASSNFLSTSDLRFTLGNKEFEVDCLGTTMFRDMTEEIIKKWKTNCSEEVSS